MAFFETFKTGYLLRIKLAPSSSFCGFRGIYADEKGNEFLKAAVTVVPEKGKANKELIRLLSKELGIAKSQITLISGETEHLKKLYLEIPQTAEFSVRLHGLIKE